MTKDEIRKDHRLSTSKTRREVEKDYIYETEEVTRKSYKRRYLTVVVKSTERTILRRLR